MHALFQKFAVNYAAISLQHGYYYRGRRKEYTVTYMKVDNGNSFTRSNGPIYLTTVLEMQKGDRLWVQFDQKDQAVSQKIDSSSGKPTTHFVATKIA